MKFKQKLLMIIFLIVKQLTKNLLNIFEKVKIGKALASLKPMTYRFVMNVLTCYVIILERKRLMILCLILLFISIGV